MFFIHKHRKPQARLAGWAFVDSVLLFAAIAYFKPAVGLAGLGAVMILASVVVEANHYRIWEDYKKTYKKSKDPVREFWAAPRQSYYRANIYFVWPLVFILGLVAVYTSYSLG